MREKRREEENPKKKSRKKRFSEPGRRDRRRGPPSARRPFSSSVFLPTCRRANSSKGAPSSFRQRGHLRRLYSQKRRWDRNRNRSSSCSTARVLHLAPLSLFSLTSRLKEEAKKKEPKSRKELSIVSGVTRFPFAPPSDPFSTSLDARHRDLEDGGDRRAKK